MNLDAGSKSLSDLIKEYINQWYEKSDMYETDLFVS